MSPSFWFMCDNHTFIKPEGNNLREIADSFIKIAKENLYGMVCSVIILNGSKETRRVGDVCHVDGKGNVNIEKWLKDVSEDLIVRNFGL